MGGERASDLVALASSDAGATVVGCLCGRRASGWPRPLDMPRRLSRLSVRYMATLPQYAWDVAVCYVGQAL